MELEPFIIVYAAVFFFLLHYSYMELELLFNTPPTPQDALKITLFLYGIGALLPLLLPQRCLLLHYSYMELEQ